MSRNGAEENEPYQLNNVRNQYIVTLIGISRQAKIIFHSTKKKKTIKNAFSHLIHTANVIVFASGTILGWLTPQMPRLTSEDTPNRISTDELSWVVAINCIGSTAGAIINGFVVSFVGSKRALLSLAM